MSDEMVATVVGELPRMPARDNHAGGCEEVFDPAARDGLPDHLDPCKCAAHDGVCRDCGFKVTIGSSGTEYGHARANNRAADPDGYRRDCPQRPTCCNPDGGEPQEWEGYDYRARADGGQDGGDADA